MRLQPVSESAQSAPGGASVLGLAEARRARRRKIAWDWVPFFDAVLVVMFCVFWHSDFVFLPGTPLDLPVSESADYQRIDAVISVLGDLYFFENEVFAETALAGVLAGYTDRSGDGLTLLVKIDQGRSAVSLIEIIDTAKDAGFGRVVIASEPGLQGESIFVGE